jgi:hypothetical protein
MVEARENANLPAKIEGCRAGAIVPHLVGQFDAKFRLPRRKATFRYEAAYNCNKAVELPQHRPSRGTVTQARV